MKLYTVIDITRHLRSIYNGSMVKIKNFRSFEEAEKYVENIIIEIFKYREFVQDSEGCEFTFEEFMEDELVDMKIFYDDIVREIDIIENDIA